MKTTILISLCLISKLSLGQFSECFFDQLNNPSSYPNHFFGTEIENGALVVNFADSLNTEVQWAKLDLEGNYQTFSSHLPNDYISPHESIVEVYEIGNHQFIVTQDSASINPEGIRVHKFENYTQNIGLFFLPAQLKKAYFQSYLKYGKIYVFFVDETDHFKMLKINPNTLVLENNLDLGSISFQTQNFSQNYKKIHVLFQDENNMQLFTNSNSDLVRIKITNNLAQTIETSALEITKIFGVNPSNNQIICLKNTGYRVKKYQLSFNDPLSSIALVDSFDLQGINGPSYYWKYSNDGAKEIFAYSGKVVELNNNVLTNQKNASGLFYLNHIDFLNGKPLLFGYRLVETSFNDNEMKLSATSWGEVSDLLEFKEYSYVYDFGNYNAKFGVGDYFLRPIDKTALGDFLFSKMIYASSALFVGKSGDNYYGENSTYMGESFKPGPYTNINQYSHEIIHQYNESFYVDQDMLNYHVYAIENNLTDYHIPKAIKNWPAHGDISKGQAQNLAPFIDLNQNGMYEPNLGEYPSFPGTRCLLNITHQHEEDQSNTGSGLELHSYLYNFDCEDSIQDVLFLKMELFNRGSRNYDSISSGIFNDYDLGNWNDDYIGTNVEKGLIYGYNGDNFDDDFVGQLGFQDSLPTIAHLFLKGVKFSPNNLDDNVGVTTSQTVNGFGFNDGVIDNEYKGLEFSFYITGTGTPLNQSDPLTAFEYFNYLNGKWRFGDTLFYGGTGFPGSTGATNIPSKYIFPGNSDALHYGTHGTDPGFEWSEASNNNPPGDRRIIGSFGSTPLNSGESITYHSAILSGKRIPGMGQSQIDLFAKANHVKNAFNHNLTSCGQTFNNLTEDQITFVAQKEKRKLIKIYPNPSNSKFFIELPEIKPNSEISIYDIHGKTMLNQKIENTISSFDVSTFEKGIYFIKISSNNFSETIKLIKN